MKNPEMKMHEIARNVFGYYSNGCGATESSIGAEVPARSVCALTQILSLDNSGGVPPCPPNIQKWLEEQGQMMPNAWEAMFNGAWDFAGWFALDNEAVDYTP